MRALAGIIVPVLVIGGGLWTYFGQAKRGDDGQIVSAGDLGAAELAVGDCFDDPAGDAPADAATDEVSEIGDVKAKPCTEPHDLEVFHTFELATASYPSDEELADEIGVNCLPAFDEYVGTIYEESELDIYPLWPTEAAWDAGDRSVSCSAYALDMSKLEGTVKGSGR